MFKINGEMSEQVRVETSWYHGLKCLGDEMSSFGKKGLSVYGLQP